MYTLNGCILSDIASLVNDHLSFLFFTNIDISRHCSVTVDGQMEVCFTVEFVRIRATLPGLLYNLAILAGTSQDAVQEVRLVKHVLCEIDPRS